MSNQIPFTTQEYSSFTPLAEDIKQKEEERKKQDQERKELVKKCQEYLDKFVKENNYKSLRTDFLNGCSYYLTPTGEIVKISVVFSTFYPPVFQTVEGSERQHIIELNVKFGFI